MRAQAEKMTVIPAIHPKPGENGQPVIIKHPSTPSPIEAWNDPTAVAICVPGGSMPAELNGVQFAPWNDHPRTAEEWNAFDGLKPDLIEPAMKVTPGLKASAGVVVVEPDGRVWLVHPTNAFGGYRATWPKGRVEGGLSMQATACRECFEESGLKVRIVGVLGDFDRTTTRTRYYLAERTGGSPSLMGWESQAASLTPLEALPDLLNGAADAPVLEVLQQAIANGDVSRGEVLAEGGNLVRTLQALDGFFAVHGRWPTQLQLYPECLIDLATWHLTPTGFYRLQSKVRLHVERETRIVARDEQGREFDYGACAFEVTNTGTPARRWLGL